MSGERALRIGIVAGEESGDLLGADLVAALARSTGRPVELVGVGGRHLADLGLKSLFDGSEIALMGISAILRDLPRLMRRIGQVARAIAAVEPDCLVTIDSPAFSLRVAKKVRALAPSIPIVHYVCPSVWAWRSSRAAAMKPHVDHVLCLLPFEPEALARLDGPPGTFVGHRLLTEPGLERAALAQATPRDLSPGRQKQILVLPGSRRGEVRRLAGFYGDVIGMLKQRGHDLRIVLPTVPHVANMVGEATANWAVKPQIVIG
ncbi:MAG: lipid-A-disaccharide synthase, partial [Rhizobiaceae bacterium]